MITQEFSVGVLHGWRGVLLGLLASLVFLVGGRQDLGPRLGMINSKRTSPPRWASGQQVVGPGLGMLSSAFWFLLALASTISVIWLGVGARIWLGALLGVAVFCLEIWLIQRWWRRTRSP